MQFKDVILSNIDDGIVNSIGQSPPSGGQMVMERKWELQLPLSIIGRRRRSKLLCFDIFNKR